MEKIEWKTNTKYNVLEGYYQSREVFNIEFLDDVYIIHNMKSVVGNYSTRSTLDKAKDYCEDLLTR